MLALFQSQNVNPGRYKTAIVVETGLHLGIAEEFARIVKDLPCDIRVFSNIRSAEDWISK